MTSPRPPTCFLHVGTHKTGTTTLQALLAANEHTLAELGVHVPRAGRPWPQGGHHNIAWELNDDERFDPAHGTLAHLAEEIAAVGAPTVCVSSEDLEGLHMKPERLTHLSAALRSAGYDVEVVVYLRNQVDYARSLYPTLVVPYGLAMSFDDFVETVLATGAARAFRFEYSVLLNAFAGVFGRDRMIVRPYRSDVPDDVLPRDFLGVIAPGVAYERLATVGRLNPSPTWHETIDALRRNLARRAARPAEDGPVRPLSRATALRIVRRFDADNRLVHEQYGVRVPPPVP